MVGKLDKEIIEKFIEFQENTGKHSELYIENVEFQSKGVQNIFDTVRRGSSPRPIKEFIVDSDYPDKKYNWLKIGDVTRSNIYLKKTSQYINEDGKNKSVLGEKGDFLVTNSMTVGVPIILDIDTCFHDGFLYLGFDNRKQKEFSSLYLYYFFTSFREKLILKSKDGIVKNLNTDIMKEVEIPIPKDLNKFYSSYQIQEAIVEFFKYSFEKIDRIKKNIDKRHDIFKRLQKALIPSTFIKDYVKIAFGRYAKEKGIELDIMDVKFTEVNFNNFFDTVTPPKKIKNKNAKLKGKYPVVSQSEGIINGYTNDEDGYIDANNKPLIIFGDHTTIVKYVDFKFFVGADGTKILKAKDKLLPKYAYYQSVNKVKQQGYQRHFQYLKKEVFLIPNDLEEYTSLEVQKIIADFIEYTENRLQKEFDKMDEGYNNLKRLHKTYLARTFSLIDWGVQ